MGMQVFRLLALLASSLLDYENQQMFFPTNEALFPLATVWRAVTITTESVRREVRS